MTRRLVVTGTDTGVGKTVVGAGVARVLAERGYRVVAIKPVESGVGGAAPANGSRSAENGRPAAEDGELLAAAAGQQAPARALTRLSLPVAPPLAADDEGITLDAEDWLARIEGFARDTDVLIVEGAGGLRSPLTWSFDTRDLASRLGADVLVVAADRLGTLSQVLLVHEALVAADLAVLGIVLSAVETPDSSSGQNLEVLGRYMDRERLCFLPRVADVTEASRHLGTVADWVLVG